MTLLVGPSLAAGVVLMRLQKPLWKVSELRKAFCHPFVKFEHNAEYFYFRFYILCTVSYCKFQTAIFSTSVVLFIPTDDLV